MERYTQTQTAKETMIPQSTLSDLSKRHKLGRIDDDGKRYYSLEELEWIKAYKVKNHNKVIAIIKRFQPLTYKELVHKSEFSKDKTMRLLTEITGTLDDPAIDINIWEDENEKLYYGTDNFRNKFFGEY